MSEVCTSEIAELRVFSIPISIVFLYYLQVATQTIKVKCQIKEVQGTNTNQNKPTETETNKQSSNRKLALFFYFSIIRVIFQPKYLKKHFLLLNYLLQVTSVQISNESDRKEAQNRERRRQCELERRNRIFNARNRKIGVDVPFLERQIAEKTAERDEQKRKDLAFAKQMIKDNELGVVLAARDTEERRRIEAEIANFRSLYQRPEDRREFDLNDPDALKKQLPPRASDGEPVGLSSAQKFEGEDLNLDERRKIMATQRNAWLEQQVQERKNAEEERKKAEAAYMMAIIARDARAGELDKLERECRYRLGQANLRYNEALAAEKKQLEAVMKEQEESDNTAEMYNNLTSDMLTENPDVAKSALGGNRAIGFMYKGMNQEELKKFYAAQKEQMAASKAKREAEQKMDAEWQALSKSIQDEVCRLDIEDKRKRREIARQLMEENQLMALQQKEKEKYYRDVVNNNVPTDDYYSQFNTTTR